MVALDTPDLVGELPLAEIGPIRRARHDVARTVEDLSSTVRVTATSWRTQGNLGSVVAHGRRLRSLHEIWHGTADTPTFDRRARDLLPSGARSDDASSRQAPATRNLLRKAEQDHERSRRESQLPDDVRATERLDDVLDALLGVAEEHLAVVLEEQRVLHAGVAGGHGALEDDDVACAFQTSSTGMPAIGTVGSSAAAGLTVSLAPMTRTTSVSGKSSLISSISRTMS